MTAIRVFIVLFISAFALSARAQELTGMVTDGSGSPIEGAAVQLPVAGESALTGSDGAWRINVSTSVRPSVNALRFQAPLWNGTALKLFVTDPAQSIRVTVDDMNGKTLAVLVDKNLDAGIYTLEPESGGFAPGIYILNVRQGENRNLFNLPVVVRRGSSSTELVRAADIHPEALLKTAAVIDTIKVSKAGFQTAAKTIEEYAGDHPMTLLAQNERRIPLAEYESKMEAGWLGQHVGVGWGGPTEFQFMWDIIPEVDVPNWTPDMANQFWQDDLFVDIEFIRSLHEFGIDITSRRAGIEWARNFFGLNYGNRLGLVNLKAGIAPPDCSHPDTPPAEPGLSSRWAEFIDFQIDADFAGLVAPGMVNVAIEVGEKYGRLMSYGDGLYAGQFVAAMYSEAFFETDMKKVVAYGLTAIPDSSLYARVMRDVIAWHGENPADWTSCWQKFMDKYGSRGSYKSLDPVSAVANGAFIVIGLLYGNNSIEETIKISMRCGFDSDCNPANAGGIIFTSLGMENIPSQYTSGFNPSNTYSFNQDYSHHDVLTATRETAVRFVERHGRFQIDGGDTTLVVPVKDPVPSAFTQWDNPADTLVGSRYTKEEMDEMNSGN